MAPASEARWQEALALDVCMVQSGEGIELLRYYPEHSYALQERANWRLDSTNQSSANHRSQPSPSPIRPRQEL